MSADAASSSPAAAEAADNKFLDELERELEDNSPAVIVTSASEEEMPAVEDDAAVPLEEQVARLRKENHQLMVLLSRTNEEAETEKQRMVEETECRIERLKQNHAQEIDELQRQIEETRRLGLEMSKKAEGEAVAASKSAELIATLQDELHVVKNKLREETDKLNTQIQQHEKQQQEWAQEKQRLSRAASPKEVPAIPEKGKKRADEPTPAASTSVEARPVVVAQSSASSTTATATTTTSTTSNTSAATTTTTTTATAPIAVTIPTSSSNSSLTGSPTDSPKNARPLANSPSSSSAAASRKETSSPMSTTGSNACLVCGKTVFPMDKLSVDGRILHKVCFRCSHCNSKLSGTNFCFYKEKAFCKPHFIQLFRLKGSYNDLE